MTRLMKFPNNLAAHMRRANINDPALAAKANTSKQQIGKLRLGTRQMTKAWATRLAPHLGTTWAALMEEPTVSGFAEKPLAFYDGAASSPFDPDEMRATIQEAVAAALTEHHLPNTQADIYRVSKAVERDLEALGELPRFPATLDLRVSEKVSELQLKWQQAKASL